MSVTIVLQGSGEKVEIVCLKDSRDEYAELEADHPLSSSMLVGGQRL